MSFLILLASTGLALEGLAVNTLCLCGVCFVCSYLDRVKRAVVYVAAVILALCYGAFDALVCVFHIHSLLLNTEISIAIDIAFNSIYRIALYIHF